MSAPSRSWESHGEAAASDEPEPAPRETDGGAPELPDGIVSLLDTPASPATAEAAPSAAAAPLLPALGLARVLEIEDSGAVRVRVGDLDLAAELAPSLHPLVVKTAMERGEPVLFERAGDGTISLVGALRTQPTPGVDAMKHVEIEAETIHLRGTKEVSLSTSGIAQLAVRAIGEVETYADRIVSRAEELHKIVGRMLRLN